MDYRAIIVAWIAANGCTGPWMLHLYTTLTVHCGATPDEAMRALSAFVEDIITEKKRKARVP